MAKLNWTEYKEYKQHTQEQDRLKIVLSFLKSYYNMHSPMDMYKMLSEDDIGQMMLEKRDITDAEGLENFMFKS